MKIRLGYDIAFETPREVAMVAMLHVHPSRIPDLLEPDTLETNTGVPVGVPEIAPLLELKLRPEGSGEGLIVTLVTAELIAGLIEAGDPVMKT